MPAPAPSRAPSPAPSPHRDRRLIVAASTAESFALLGTLFFPALLPTFQAEWALTNTDAGWINGVFYAGYALASPFLIGLTDRFDPRRIYLANAALGGIAMFGFSLFAAAVQKPEAASAKPIMATPPKSALAR